MKRVIYFTLFFVFAFTGCASNGASTCDYPFLHPSDDILSVEIGMVHARDSEKGVVIVEEADRFESFVKLGKDDLDYFLEIFRDVDCWKIQVGDPRDFHPEEIVIYVQYVNGDFEYIDSYAQATYSTNEFRAKFLSDDSKHYRTTSYYTLDQVEFDNLMQSVLNEGLTDKNTLN